MRSPTSLCRLALLLAALPACAATPNPGAQASDTAAAHPMDWVDARALTADLGVWSAATPEKRAGACLAVAKRLPEFSFQRVASFASGGRRHAVGLFLHRPTELEFALVPGGKVYGLRLTTGLLVARTEVPQDLWVRVMGDNPSAFPGPRRPVDSATWDEATRFCDRLGLSLPTSEQWEFACRACTDGRFSFGDDVDALSEHAWFDGNAGGATRPVGGRRPNAFGLHDMHGNVREWCRDRVGGIGSDPDRSLSLRVVRGGGFDRGADRQGSDARNWGTPDTRMPNLGLRPVRSLGDE